MTPGAKNRLWFAGSIVAVLALALASFGRNSVAEVTHAMQRAVAFCRAAGPLAFFAAMALLPSFGFPLAPFVLAAGPAFAPILGAGGVILCSIAAVTVNVALSYWIAARLLRPVTARLTTRLGYRLPEVGGNSAWIATLALRIVPGPPFFLQSYLLGLARVPFGIYLSVSTLVPLGYLTGLILFGDALARGDRWAAVGAAAIIFTVGGIIRQLRKRLTPPVTPDGT